MGFSLMGEGRAVRGAPRGTKRTCGADAGNASLSAPPADAFDQADNPQEEEECRHDLAEVEQLRDRKELIEEVRHLSVFCTPRRFLQKIRGPRVPDLNRADPKRAALEHTKYRNRTNRPRMPDRSPRGFRGIAHATAEVQSRRGGGAGSQLWQRTPCVPEWT